VGHFFRSSSYPHHSFYGGITFREKFGYTPGLGGEGGRADFVGAWCGRVRGVDFVRLMQQVHALQKFLKTCIGMQRIKPRISIYERHRRLSGAVGSFQVSERLVILAKLGIHHRGPWQVERVLVG
jgi:hypothetical protein